MWKTYGGCPSPCQCALWIRDSRAASPRRLPRLAPAALPLMYSHCEPLRELSDRGIFSRKFQTWRHCNKTLRRIEHTECSPFNDPINLVFLWPSNFVWCQAFFFEMVCVLLNELTASFVDFGKRLIDQLCWETADNASCLRFYYNM